MSAFAAFTQVHRVRRLGLPARRRRAAVSTATQVAPHNYIPHSTADLWRSARPRPGY